MKENVISARKRLHAFRFIDDLITINNVNFEKNIQNIYPAELKLRKEKQINKNANFLDLNIKIQEQPPEMFCKKRPESHF